MRVGRPTAAEGPLLRPTLAASDSTEVLAGGVQPADSQLVAFGGGLLLTGSSVSVVCG
jgi:hypothetical protein